MTAQELKDRTELNMDDAKLAETQAKVAEMLHAEPARVAEFLHAEPMTAKTRKARSDKGVPKPKKTTAEISAGAVTKEEANDIRDAMIAIVNARSILADAQANLRLAEERFEAILGSITKGA